MRSFGRRWPASTTAPPMTTSTSGYLSLNCAWISAASLPIAASTSEELEIRSEFSRNAQDACRSGISTASFCQEPGEFPAHLRVAQAQFDRRLQVTQLGAAVIASTAKAHRQHAFAREQRRNRVGELD